MNGKRKIGVKETIDWLDSDNPIVIFARFYDMFKKESLEKQTMGLIILNLAMNDIEQSEMIIENLKKVISKPKS